MLFRSGYVSIRRIAKVIGGSNDICSLWKSTRFDMPFGNILLFRPLTTSAEEKKSNEKIVDTSGKESSDSTAKPAVDDDNISFSVTADPELNPLDICMEDLKKSRIEIKELKNSLLHALADTENARRIAKNDIESARQFAIQSFAKSLMDVADNLTRAVSCVPQAAQSKFSTVDDTNKGSDLANLKLLFEGVRMVDVDLNKTFAKHGLQKYGAVGEKFDPKIHSAMYEAEVDPSAKPTDGKQAISVGQIYDVLSVGYKLNGRSIRSANVGVARAAKPATTAETAEQPSK